MSASIETFLVTMFHTCTDSLNGFFFVTVKNLEVVWHVSS